jgi:hypothetical protein
MVHSSNQGKQSHIVELSVSSVLLICVELFGKLHCPKATIHASEIFADYIIATTKFVAFVKGRVTRMKVNKRNAKQKHYQT